MSRYRLNHDVVVNGAVELVNERGAEALSLAEVAARFHVRTPSLYNHIANLDGLRRELSLFALRSLSEQLQAACTGLAGRDALNALAAAYRAFAHANPGLYPFILRPADTNDEELGNAGVQLARLIQAALRGYKLQGEEAAQAVRAVHSALHGFVALEGSNFGNGGANGGGTASKGGAAAANDVAYNALVEMLDQGITRWAKKS